MSLTLNLKKGLDLRLNGGIESGAASEEILSKLYAIYPDDFEGFIPKAIVKEGEPVYPGSPLMHHKNDPELKLVSPVKGIVKAIVRGERRHIERIEIEASADYNSDALSFKVDNLNDTAEIRKFLKETGLWAMMRQRPFDIIPDSASIPRDIFITAIDSAPLAPDPSILAAGKDAEITAGVKLLSKLTSGKVYIGRRAGAIGDIEGAEMIDIKGPHPAGNPSVMIANISPVNKGECVWTLNLMTLRRIGETIINGNIPFDTVVAVTGSEVKHPKMVRTIIGVELKALLQDNLKETNHIRIISGNVLVGKKETIEAFLHSPYRHVTVIPEGDNKDEFMGWASLSPKKMSESRSFPSRFLPFKRFTPDARLNGGKRAFIMSGEYDKYLPMDIMSEYLLKAFMAGDIEKMEKLGAYEVAPEDFALGEYADTSKIEAQKIVRAGLDKLRKENE